MECSPPGSSVHGFFQPKISEELPFPPPGREEGFNSWGLNLMSYVSCLTLMSPALAGGFFTPKSIDKIND